VPRPVTTVADKPFATATRTGRSTGCRCQRRVVEEGGILADGDLKSVLSSNYESLCAQNLDAAALMGRKSGAVKSSGQGCPLYTNKKVPHFSQRKREMGHPSRLFQPVIPKNVTFPACLRLQ
jgi:hypothetical protein